MKVPIPLSIVIGFALAQAGLPTPPPPRRATITSVEHGEIVEVDLATLASDIGHYDRKQVRTKGRLERLEDSRRDPDDWVLKEGDRCLWVTGKRPTGRGFSLDPGHQADTSHWLEVMGLRIVNGILYLRASKVALAKPPDPGGRPR